MRPFLARFGVPILNSYALGSLSGSVVIGRCLQFRLLSTHSPIQTICDIKGLAKAARALVWVVAEIQAAFPMYY